MPRPLLALAAALAVVLGTVGCTNDASVDPAPTPTPAPTVETVPDPEVVAVDSGATEMAMGEATLIEEGRYDYVVAPGDVLGSVAARFGLCVRDLSPVTEQGLSLMAGETFVVERRVDDALGTVECTMG